MDSTIEQIRQIDSTIAALKARNKALSAEKTFNTEQIEALEKHKDLLAQGLFTGENADAKSIRVDGVLVTQADITAYEGFDLSTRLFAEEKEQYRKSTAETLRIKAAKIENGTEKVSESDLLRFILSIPSGIKKMERFEVKKKSYRFRGL